jgi:glucose-6-phosphate 1-dehydrogenase
MIGPCTIVVFGASGDLTKRKLVPALFNLQQEGLFPEKLNIIGVARRAMSSEQFREKAKAEYKEFLTTPEVEDAAWDKFIGRWEYLSGNFDTPDTFKSIQVALEKIDKDDSPRSYLFYLATPPEFFSTIVKSISEAGLTEEKNENWRRIIIEKPFGRDLESAKALNKEIGHVVKESQIFRIDHYLGKETVQNIMVFRFANGIFEPIWNRRYIDHVQITVAETLGIESRASYYEKSGALRDMVPNHLFQLLTLVGMEAPNSFDSEAVRDEKVKALQSIRLDKAIRGQYGPGVVEGKEAKGYRHEEGVKPNSATDTFAALKLYVDNWRWAEVPFYLRTGKRLPVRTSEISIQFKCPPFQIFNDTKTENICSNELLLQIQPEERITLRFEAKVPGHQIKVKPVAMGFDYADAFHEKPTTGYETLIYDCMIGDPTLFQRSDQIENAWKIVTPILKNWEESAPQDFPNYSAGMWGPKEAEDLLTADGRSWRNPVELPVKAIHAA